MKKNYFDLKLEVLTLTDDIVRTSNGDNIVNDNNDDYNFQE